MFANTNVYQKIGILFLSSFVFLFNTGSTLRSNSPQSADKPIVVMISIDGFRNDYLQKYQPVTLNKLAKEGASSQGLIPSFPSLTFPNHMTLVTGMAPGHHGIVSNFFYDKKRKAAYQMNDAMATNDGSWYRGEPLWAITEKSGMLAATCFWVGSEARIGGIDPTYIRPYDGTVSNQARVDQVLQWLQLPVDQRPHFISLYFSDVDSAGHKYGPDSNEVRNAVGEIDKALGTLVSWSDHSDLPIQFVVVSDHGMMPVKAQIDLTLLADLKNFTSLERGATTSLYANEYADIQGVYQELKKAEKNFKVYRPQDLPPEWKYTDTDRTGDLVLVAEPGYYMVRQESFAETPAKASSVATHGWDPKTEQMKGLFIARGSMIRPGFKVPAFKNTDVYPLVLNLLSMTSNVPNDSNPNVLKPILKNKRNNKGSI